MKLNGLVLSALVLSGGVALADLAAAASLAGNEGDVRSRPNFGDGGPCKKAWDQYVASAGHSAYATTPYSRMSEAIICGATVNAGSKAAAEDQAMASCKAGLKRWKMSVVRKCAIAASK